MCMILHTRSVKHPGERRWRAAKLVGLTEIPVIVRPTGSPLLRQLVEEFHKEGVPTIERARAMRQLRDAYQKEMEGMDVASIRATYGLLKVPNTHLTPEAVTAKKLGINPDRVHDLLAMLKEPELRPLGCDNRGLAGAAGPRAPYQTRGGVLPREYTCMRLGGIGTKRGCAYRV